MKQEIEAYEEIKNLNYSGIPSALSTAIRDATEEYDRNGLAYKSPIK